MRDRWNVPNRFRILPIVPIAPIAPIVPDEPFDPGER